MTHTSIFSRRGLRRGVLALLAGVLAAVGPAHAQDFDRVDIQTVPVADGLYMLIGQGGNLGVSAGEDGVFLIDDQYAPLHAKIVAAVSKISTQPIRFVLNTHWHGDHTGGNELLGQGGALIVAHDNVRTRLEAGQFMTFFNRSVPPAPADALPILTFDESVTFYVNGQEIHAFHVDPAHTDGDAVVHFRTANVIHTGDVYFAGRYPFIDIESGGSINGVITAVDRIKNLCDVDTQIIPGHGPLSNAAELHEYREMLATVRDAIAALIAEGKSLKEVQAAKPTAAYDDAYTDFITGEQFTGLVYLDLTGTRPPS